MDRVEHQVEIEKYRVNTIHSDITIEQTADYQNNRANNMMLMSTFHSRNDRGFMSWHNLHFYVPLSEKAQPPNP